MTQPSPLPESPDARAAALIARFGPHPATTLGLDLETGEEQDLGRWLVACCLLSQRFEESTALTACRELGAPGLAEPVALASRDLAELTSVLEQAGVPRAERVAMLLLRVSRSFLERFGASFSNLVGGAEGLEELGGRLTSLASGFGRSGVARFLRPLRSVWPAAEDVPPERAARAAAIHLGWMSEQDEELVGPGRLRGIAQGEPFGARWYDLEAALERIGRRACLGERASRCPLGSACPLRHPA
jgi:hypothetical protein